VSLALTQDVTEKGYHQRPRSVALLGLRPAVASSRVQTPLLIRFALPKVATDFVEWGHATNPVEERRAAPSRR